MNYLYHRVPENMKGDLLHPLNKLKDIYPDLYKEKAKKYEGRSSVMNRKIPYLNCLWNDVLHLTAVPPRELKKALEGARNKSISPLRYYKINPKIIDKEKTIVYLYNFIGKSEDKMTKDNFSQYNSDDLDKFSKISKETKGYYKKMFKENKKPLLYVKIPHILYKGSINTKDISIIKV